MTSSATQTEGPARSPIARWASERTDVVVGAALLVGGWLLILFVYHWYLSPSVVFLCLGWLALLLCGRFLWTAALAAAGEGLGPEGERGGFELSATRVDELEREKKALLKAIKEVEFDREMGKMSEEDAGEIVRIYRARAIEILKELDGAAEDGSAGPAGSIDDIIEREVRARLALAGIRAKAVEKAAAQKKKEARKGKAAPAEAAAAAATEPAAAAEPSPEAAAAEPSSEEAAAEPSPEETAAAEPSPEETAAAEPAATPTESDGEDPPRREASE